MPRARRPSATEVGSRRLLLIPLEQPLSRALVVTLAIGVAAWLAALMVRPAVADYLAWQATSLEDVERALAWDPASPILHRRLGRLHEAAGDAARARHHFETAARLRPTDAYPWLGLATLADRQGDRAGARQALARALALDPHSVTVRWEAALLAFRWGEREQALEHFRYVLAVDTRQREAAFQLARLLLRPQDDPARLLPAEPERLTPVLAAAVGNQDLELADVAWRRLSTLQPAIPEDLGRQYLNLLLAERDGARARRVWASLVRFGSTGAGNAVFNGGFDNDRLLGWGLDWRVSQTWGVDVMLDRFIAAGGRHSLRLAFNSFPGLDFAGVWQMVGVEPGRQYHLQARARASEFVTASGLKLQVVLPDTGEVLGETPAVAGTTDWIALEATVRIPADVSLVVLRLRREPAPRPEGNLGGKVWVDEVALR